MKKLDNPQEKIYQYIVDYFDAHDFPPSVREICEAVGLTSTATVHVHLKNLERKGLIVRNPGKQRSIQIAGAAPAVTFGRVCAPIPLVGHVAAGVPILAEENVEDAFPLPDILLRGSTHDEVFMLRVEGESMINAGIQSGDIIVVSKGCSVSNGDIVVARISGESATVKRIYRESSNIRLQPENELFEPIYVPFGEVEIAGKVIGLMRSI